jgi:hypothetical protein
MSSRPCSKPMKVGASNFASSIRSIPSDNANSRFGVQATAILAEFESARGAAGKLTGGEPVTPLRGAQVNASAL